MKTQKLLVIAAIVCLSVVFLFGSTHADADDLAEVIIDYCEDVARDAEEGVEELVEANLDLLDCSVEFFDCLDGFGKPEPLECAVDVRKCQKRGLKDTYRACNEFLNEFKRDTKRAETRADIKDVLPAFIAWFFSDNSDECLEQARAITEFCAGIIDIEELVHSGD